LNSSVSISPGERQQRLAGARLTEQRDEVDLRIHQQVEREVLLAVARRDPPDIILLVRVVLECGQKRRLAGDFLDDRVERRFAGLFLVQEFVQMQRRNQRAGDAIVRMTALLPRLHAFRVPVPEVGRKLAHARIKELGILEHLVVEIVLGGDAQRARLDAQVDVLGHQDHVAARMMAREVHGDREDLVVRLAVRKRRRQRRRDRLGLQEQSAGGGAARFLVQRNPLHDGVGVGARVRGHELVEKSRGLPRVSRDFGHPLLVGVELLEGEDRQIDVVFLESEQAGGIVHQHVGVEHEQLGRGRVAGFRRLARGEKVQRGRCRAELAFDHGPPEVRLLRTFGAI
jgi:hypothetical protein